MTWKGKAHILGFVRQTKGAVAVEFPIIGTLFLLIIAGVLDFGHAWYMKQSHHQCQSLKGPATG